MPDILVATLGSEPQVIPLGVQLLVRAGFSLGVVAVVHTDPAQSPVREACERLRTQYTRHAAWPPLVFLPLAIPDVLTREQLDIFGTVLYQHLRRYIAQGHAIHLLLAGGRKSMTMVGMSIAQLLLGPDDHVWYLHSDEELRLSGRAELDPADDARLIAIPLPRHRTAPPIYTRAFLADTPALAHQLLDEEQRRRISFFWQEELTPAERTAAQLAAQDLLSVAEMAAHLHKSPKTITNQLNTVYSKMESIFGLQPQIGLKREFLRYVLAQYQVTQADLGVESHDRLPISA